MKLILENWKKYLKLCARKYDLIGFIIRDPVDMELPDLDDHVLVEDPFSHEQSVFVSADHRHAYRAAAKAQVREIETIFNAADAHCLCLRTDVDFAGPIINFFRHRFRR